MHSIFFQSSVKFDSLITRTKITVSRIKSAYVTHAWTVNIEHRATVHLTELFSSLYRTFFRKSESLNTKCIEPSVAWMSFGFRILGTQIYDTVLVKTQGFKFFPQNFEIWILVFPILKKIEKICNVLPHGNSSKFGKKHKTYCFEYMYNTMP